MPGHAESVHEGEIPQLEESPHTRVLADIGRELMRIAVQKRNVPLECFTEHRIVGHLQAVSAQEVDH